MHILGIFKDDVITVEVRIESNFPRELVAHEVAMSFEMHNKDAVEVSSDPFNA